MWLRISWKSVLKLISFRLKKIWKNFYKIKLYINIVQYGKSAFIIILKTLLGFLSFTLYTAHGRVGGGNPT